MNDAISTFDLYAAAALQGLLAHPDQQPPEVIVLSALRYANAMQNAVDAQRQACLPPTADMLARAALARAGGQP